MRSLTAYLLAVPAGIAGVICLSMATMSFAADKAIAAQALPTARWDYATVKAGWQGVPIEQLGTLGRDGWELCGVQYDHDDYTSYVYFKRRKP